MRDLWLWASLFPRAGSVVVHDYCMYYSMYQRGIFVDKVAFWRVSRSRVATGRPAVPPSCDRRDEIRRDEMGRDGKGLQVHAQSTAEPTFAFFVAPTSTLLLRVLKTTGFAPSWCLDYNEFHMPVPMDFPMNSTHRCPMVWKSYHYQLARL